MCFQRDRARKLREIIAQDLRPTNDLYSAGQESTIGTTTRAGKGGVLVENLGYVQMASRRHCTPKALHYDVDRQGRLRG